MRLVLLKVNIDIINGGLASAMVGTFNKEGVLIESKLMPGKLFDKDFEYREGQELILAPAIRA